MLSHRWRYTHAFVAELYASIKIMVCIYTWHTRHCAGVTNGGYRVFTQSIPFMSRFRICHKRESNLHLNVHLNLFPTLYQLTYLGHLHVLLSLLHLFHPAGNIPSYALSWYNTLLSMDQCWHAPTCCQYAYISVIFHSVTNKMYRTIYLSMHKYTVWFDKWRWMRRQNWSRKSYLRRSSSTNLYLEKASNLPGTGMIYQRWLWFIRLQTNMCVGLLIIRPRYIVDVHE